MSEIKYKTGWIKDPEGNKFAPITTTDQVITSDGADLASEINNMKNDVTTLNSKMEQLSNWSFVRTIFAQDIVDDLEASFNNASNYSLYSGTTTNGVEGGWYAFKNNSSKDSCGVYFTSQGSFIIKRDTLGQWLIKLIH